MNEQEEQKPSALEQIKAQRQESKEAEARKAANREESLNLWQNFLSENPPAETPEDKKD